MPNPTIYKHPKEIIHNPDKTTTEIERNLRQNGDLSVIVKIKDANRHTLVVYHIVYDQTGQLVHGPHEESGSRDATYQGALPEYDYYL